jgi:hypothetical protein
MKGSCKNPITNAICRPWPHRRHAARTDREESSLHPGPDCCGRCTSSRSSADKSNFPSFKAILDCLAPPIDQCLLRLMLPESSRSFPAFPSSCCPASWSTALTACPLDNPPFRCGQKSAFSLEMERHFGDKRKVHLLARHGSLGGQESRVPSHDFTNAISVCTCALSTCTCTALATS